MIFVPNLHNAVDITKNYLHDLEFLEPYNRVTVSIELIYTCTLTVDNPSATQHGIHSSSSGSRLPRGLLSTGSSQKSISLYHYYILTNPPERFPRSNRRQSHRHNNKYPPLSPIRPQNSYKRLAPTRPHLLRLKSPTTAQHPLRLPNHNQKPPQSIRRTDNPTMARPLYTRYQRRRVGSRIGPVED